MRDRNRQQDKKKSEQKASSKKEREFKTPFLEAIQLYFLSRCTKKGGQQTIRINSTLLGSGNPSLLCGMEKIEWGGKMRTQPAWLNDGVRIIGDHQFSEAENGNMLVRAHRFTWAGTAGSLRDRRGNLSKTLSRIKKNKNCHTAPKGLIAANWNSPQA